MGSAAIVYFLFLTCYMSIVLELPAILILGPRVRAAPTWLTSSYQSRMEEKMAYCDCLLKLTQSFDFAEV